MKGFYYRFGLGLVFLMTLSFSTASGQGTATIPVKMPCGQCTESLLTSAKAIKGVESAKFDPVTSALVVTHGAGTSSLDISLELSMAGYDAGDFKRDAKAPVLACCKSNMRGDEEDDAIGDLEMDEELLDWEDPSNLDALESLSETASLDNLLDDEEEDDSDLTLSEDNDGFEEVDEDDLDI